MKKFDNEIAELQSHMRDMGRLTREMFGLVCEGLEQPNNQVHAEVTQLESELDKAQVDIDEEVVRLMTIYSPVASDLRNLVVAMHMTTQLERIGDQVVNICEALALMDTDHQRPGMSDLTSMAKLVGNMLEGALDAYFDRDVQLAKKVWEQDDFIDARNDQITKKLLSYEALSQLLRGKEDVADVLAVILLARHLERIADQSVNICKDIVYMVEGHDVRHEDPV